MRSANFAMFLALAYGTLAVAVPATVPSSIPKADVTIASSGGGIVRREDIPPGVKVASIHDVGKRDDSLTERSTNPAFVLKRSDCHGSGYCSSISMSDCQAAYNRYDDNTAYCGYTSRVVSFLDPFSGYYGCTAIYTCSNYNGNCMYGWWLKQQFAKVYSVVGCGICGSYTIPDGAVIGCRATLNYCRSCKDVGS